MAPTLELILDFLGMGACIAASAYLYFTGNKRAGTLLFFGFALHMQLGLYMNLAEEPVGNGACWYEKGDFYACLPLGQKLSIHAAQFGRYLIALGVFLLALSSRPKQGNAS